MSSRATAWTLPATVWARAGSAHAQQASRRYAAMLPTQRVPAAALHVHARYVRARSGYVRARSGRGWDAARCVERRVGTRHAGRSSALALRSAAPLPYAALRSAAQARPYAVQRNAEPAPQNVERALRSAGPPLRDAARRVRPVDRAAPSLRRSSWLRQKESLSPRLDRDDATLRRLRVTSNLRTLACLHCSCDQMAPLRSATVHRHRSQPEFRA